MTRPTATTSRCDRILSLIDACLAEVDRDFRVIDGGRRLSTVPAPIMVPARHYFPVRGVA